MMARVQGRGRFFSRLSVIAVTAGAAMLGTSSCGGGTPRDLVVTAYSPQTAVASATPIEVRFDRPVIDEGQVGTPIVAGEVVLRPAVPWHGEWRDRQTLVIDLDRPLAPSTHYVVTLGGELARRTGGFRFGFVHQPLEVEGLVGDDPERVPGDGPWRLGFNQRVAAADAAQHCALIAGDARIALAATSATEVGTEVALRPQQKLTADAPYTLRCENLKGAGGDAPMLAAWEQVLRTRASLFVKRASPDGRDVAADEVSVEVIFSTPVTLEAARGALSATPPITGLGQGWLDDGGTRYRVTADLDTETEYTIEVKDLVDTYGQRLTAPFAHVFTTGDARPRISMERGIYALEASARGYPIWTRNVKRYEIECAAVPTAALVQALTTDLNYDPWSGSSAKPIGWKQLKIKPNKQTVAVVGAKNKWHLDDVDLGKVCAARPGSRGVYLADVRSSEIVIDKDQPWRTPTSHRLLANVTDLGVLIKAGPASGLVWVTSLASGAPVAGASVTVYTPRGKVVHRGVTDGDGLVRTPGSAALLGAASGSGAELAEWDSFRAQRLIAVVEHDSDIAVVDGNWTNGIQIWNFGVGEDRTGGKTKIRGFIQSDRGLYRPGEHVHFKGLVRELAAGRGPRVPTLTKPIAITVADSRGATVLETAAPLSAFGGFAFDLGLGPDAAVGDYVVIATADNQVFRESFIVEEFRPATFEVKFEASDDHIRPGDRVAGTINAQYLFGAPVAAAQVAWSVSRRDHVLRFPGLDAYTFDAERRWWWDESEDYGELVGDGTGTTDAQGRLSFALRDPDAAATGPRDYVISAQVTDETDQTIGKSRVVTAHPTDVYVGVHTQEYVQAVGMPFAINVVAVNPNGTRVAADATLSLVRVHQDCAWDDRGFRSYSSCTEREEITLQRAIKIPATGAATERVVPKAPGDYRVRIDASDSRGTKVRAASELWVIGKGEAFWSGDESARMSLIASRPSYRPGDRARLVPQAGLRQPTALITVERDGILSVEVKKLDSPGEGMELNIPDAWAPNVFASVVLVQGRQGPTDRDRPQMKMGVVELKVSSEHKRMNVAIATDRPSYRPGETVTGTITVTHGRRPVAAEVSLSVADEGVLQLINYQTPDPMKTFYASFGLGVDSATNWNRIARLADPQQGDPDEGGDGGGGDNQRIRTRFLSSAYWAPALVTDGKGQVRFTFTAPDNLTSYRLMAVAADAADRFGAGDLRIAIAQPLMAQPVLPRFFSADDTESIGVVIYNRTGAAGTATVTARATGLTLRDQRKSVDVPAGGQARVRFAAKTHDTDLAKVEFAVELGAERDALALEVPVRQPRVRTARLVNLGKVGAGPVSIALNPSSGALLDESEVTVTVDRTGLGDLEPSLRYLVEYPYGCLEQTLSRFLPLAKAKDLAASMKLSSLPANQVDAFLAAGVAKVIRHQQGDGHFSLWPSSETYPHLTVYALFGLREAENAGMKVPREVYTRGRTALSQWLATDEAWQPRQLGIVAMATYLFARDGKPDHGAMAKLYERRASVPTWGLAFLARAMKIARSDKQQLATLKDKIVAAARYDGAAATIADDGVDPSYHMGSTARATAMVLSALLELAPREPLIDALVAGLDRARDGGGRWQNTQDNLWALIGFADYARRAAAGSATVTIASGARTLVEGRAVGGEVIVARAKLAEVKDGITVTSSTPVHYRVRMTEVSRDAGAAIARGFTVSREYVDRQGAAVTAVKAGDLVTVRLSIDNPVDRRWVALVDPLPAGLEPVNPRLQATPDPSGSGRSWEWNHQELRDDQVRWFADYLWSGRFELTYQARATIDGSFYAGPATIEAMYEPTTMGRGAAATFTVMP